jgi:hypothetical protein
MKKVLRSEIVYLALAAAIGLLLISVLQSGPDRKTRSRREPLEP